MNNEVGLKNLYSKLVLQNTPRVLSQIDRDEDSPTFGSCDRNFWHYKIRDFSSAILQQSGLSLAVLYNLDFDDNPYFANQYIKKIAIGTLEYWTKIQLRDGSFNEYYPNEHGFPPTAFSFFTACEIIKELQLNPDIYYESLKRTAKYLITHFEAQASNQEMGSIAALYSYYTICNETWVLDGVNIKLQKILSTQSIEGWFPEYGGADFGYLSVCFDMLAEYFHQSGDNDVIEPLNKIVEFIKYFVHPDGTIGGEYGSRNTMYFVPFALEKMIQLDNRTALEIRNQIYKNINDIDYYQNAIDDRYFSHYILHSYLRAIKEFPNNPDINDNAMDLPCYNESEKYFPDAGLLSINNGNYFAVCSLRKGGLIKIFRDIEIYGDFGYRITSKKYEIAATNWLDNNYVIRYGDKKAVVEGNFNLIKPQVSGPIKHMLLRILVFFVGNRIIGFLKKKLIFVNNHLDVAFKREIIFDTRLIRITDKILSPNKIEVKTANSLSLRHVASGKFFKSTEMLNRYDAVYNEGNDFEVIKIIHDDGNVEVKKTL